MKAQPIMSGKILVLGAGRVSGPCIDVLTRREKCSITVVSVVQEELDHIKIRYPTVDVVRLDVQTDTHKVGQLVSQHDIVISLLSYHLHLSVAEWCIQHRKNLLTASYESKEMKALNDRAAAAGIIILNECGLDPGIDHMIAMNCIETIKHNNGQVISLISICGGLPAPECSHCPLRYKCSWYPKGVLLSAMRPATYCRDGKNIDVPSGHIFDKPETVCDLLEDEILENIPNGDALAFIDVYDIPSVKTMYRGTIRYQGYSSDMQALISLGLLDDQEWSVLSSQSPGITWRNLLCELLHLPVGSPPDVLETEILNRTGQDSSKCKLISELGLLEEEYVPKLNTPMNLLANQLATKLMYASDEQDMVIMRTIIEASFPDGAKQCSTLDLITLGQREGYSAMSRTVGVTIASCADLLLDGSVQTKGVILPVTSDIYRPVLGMLAKQGITVKSSVKIYR